jgi:hypothetical protein
MTLWFALSLALGVAWPPPGWRVPTDADYSGDWQEFRKDVPVPFHVEGDFDGDGLSDEAWILLRSSGDGWMVVARMSQKGKPSRLIDLVKPTGEASAQYHGIALAKPGRYETACGKGYFECKPGEPEVLDLKRPGIEFFKYESASSIFFWDSTSRRFRQVWTSD